MKPLDHHVQLIKGSFTPAGAADVLLSLINKKIKFHNVQLLSIHENYNGDTKRSEERIKELKEARTIIHNMVLHAHKAGSEIEINGSIDIHLKSAERFEGVN